MARREKRNRRRRETKRIAPWGGIVRIVALVFADVFTFLSCWIVTLAGYKFSGIGMYRYDYYALGVLIMAIGFVCVNALFQLYQGNTFSPGTPLPRILEMKRLVESAVIIHVVMLAVMYYQKDVHWSHWSRFVTSCSCLFVCLVAQIVRNRVRAILHRLKIGQIPVLVVGANARSRLLCETLAHDAYSGYHVVADVPFRGARDLPQVNHVICCLPISQFQVFVGRHFKDLAHLILIPVQDLLLSSNMSVVDFQGLGGIAIFNQTRVHAYRVIKRVLEFALTMVTLIFATPLLVVLAILVKCTSRGPIFYVADRLGRNGQPIQIYKFRSMVHNASELLPGLLAENPAYREEWERNFKLAHDPRVTWLGRLMRKTSLDELPQLLNVLTGDLALIGPRPIVKKEVALYGAAWKVVRQVKPGITGLWQVSGRSETSYETRVQLDLQYIYNWSPWMDLWIFFRTIISVVRMRGAV